MRLCRNLARLSEGTGEGRKEDSYRTDAIKPAFTRFGHWKGTRHEDTAPKRLYLGTKNSAALLHIPGMLVVLLVALDLGRPTAEIAVPRCVLGAVYAL